MGNNNCMAQDLDIQQKKQKNKFNFNCPCHQQEALKQPQSNTIITHHHENKKSLLSQQKSFQYQIKNNPSQIIKHSLKQGTPSKILDKTKSLKIIKTVNQRQKYIKNNKQIKSNIDPMFDNQQQFYYQNNNNNSGIHQFNNTNTPNSGIQLHSPKVQQQHQNFQKNARPQIQTYYNIQQQKSNSMIIKKGKLQKQNDSSVIKKQQDNSSLFQISLKQQSLGDDDDFSLKQVSVKNKKCEAEKEAVRNSQITVAMNQKNMVISKKKVINNQQQKQGQYNNMNMNGVQNNVVHNVNPHYNNYQAVNQSMTQPMNLPQNQPMNLPLNHPINQPILRQNNTPSIRIVPGRLIRKQSINKINNINQRPLQGQNHQVKIKSTLNRSQSFESHLFYHDRSSINQRFLFNQESIIPDRNSGKKLFYKISTLDNVQNIDSVLFKN